MNTEGLPDEAVDSLLDLNLSRTNNNGSSSNDGSSASAMQRRLDMPMGAKPAARVIRNSKHRGTATTKAATPIIPQQPRNQSNRKAVDHTSPAVVGAIREHPRASVRSSTSSPFRPPSRFKQQQSQKQNGGFPSVKLPLGTFVKPKPLSSPRMPSTDASSSLSTAPDSLQALSASDADGMLQGMSPEEIREHVQELQDTLPANTLAFLRNRKAANNAKRRTGSVTTATATTRTVQIQEPNRANGTREKVSARDNGSSSETTTRSAEDNTLVQEKQRVADLLAGIRTYQELDQAYAKEQPDHVDDHSDGAKAGASNDDDKFAIACDLLRSSVPRQTLWAARTVYHHLSSELEAARYCSLQPKSSSPAAVATIPSAAVPYPSVLIVSLRCLLDTPFQRVNGYVLHTYILRSIYLLLQLRACPDHVVDVTSTTDDDDDDNNGVSNTSDTNLRYGFDALVYQEHYLQDSVPTPRIQDCYSAPAIGADEMIKPLPSSATGGHANVAYSTGSNAESARSDAQAFWADPMWALLTKMRIIPRLAMLLSQKDGYSAMLPPEALQAICGILAMVAQRSLGAATAIVQHASLLSDLRRLTLEPAEGEAGCNSSLALSTVRLYTALARQSRDAAAGLVCDWLVPLLAETTSCSPATAEATRVSIALQRWSLILWRALLRYSLGLEYLPSILPLSARAVTLGLESPVAADFLIVFSTILRSAWVFQLEKTKQRERISVTPEQSAVLSDAATWLTSSVLQAFLQLKEIATAFSAPMSGKWSLQHRLRHAAACMELIDSSILNSDKLGGASSEILSGLLQLLESFLASQDFRHLLLLVSASRIDGQSDQQDSRSSRLLEASAAEFLLSFLRLLRSITNMAIPGSKILKPKAHDLIIDALTVLPDFIRESMQWAPSLAQRAWLNRVRTVVACFAGESSSVPVCVKSFSCAVLGELTNGEESLAINLLSCDGIFLDSKSGDSQISTVLTKLICESEASLSQLDHSFKRMGGMGVTLDESGPFELSSLNSQAAAIQGSGTDGLLPLGISWLWQLISGLQNAPKSEDNGIFLSTLEFILELENEGSSHYAHEVPTGTKMYHIINFGCLSRDSLQDERVLQIFNELFARYTECLSISFAASFGETCLAHSNLPSTTSPAPADKDEAQAMSILEGKDTSPSYMTKTAVKSVLDLAGELCERVIDGAADSSTVTCLRIFVFPIFPDNVREEVLRRLGGLLHLLSVDGDDSIRLIRQYLCRGRSPTLSLKSLERETPSFLNFLAASFRAEACTRVDSGFIFRAAVATLSSSLAVAILNGNEASQSAMTRRLHSVHPDVQFSVLTALSKFATTDHTCEDMVRAVCEAPLATAIVTLETFSLVESLKGVKDEVQARTML